MSTTSTPRARRILGAAACLGLGLGAAGAQSPGLLELAAGFPEMPRGAADLLSYVDSPTDLTFGSGTPFNDLVYTAFDVAYMDGETDGYDTFYPVDPSREHPGADRVVYVKTTSNVDLDATYSGPAGDRIILGTHDRETPFFLRGDDGDDDDWVAIQNFDYSAGAIELAGRRADYRLVYCTEADGCATDGYYLFYVGTDEPDLIAFVFECDDVGLPVSGATPRDSTVLCNGDGVLSLDDPVQFRFVGARTEVAPIEGAVAQFGTAGKEIVGGIAADALGNVYAYGLTDADFATGETLGNSLFVTRTNPGGRQAWTTQVPISDGSLIFDAVADDDYLYCAGRTLGALPGFTNAGRWDAFLLKLDLATGEIVASDQWGNANLDGYGSIALDGAGHLYVSGAGSPTGQNSTDPDHLVAKHRTSDLANVWRVLDAPNTTERVFVSEAWGGVSYYPGDEPGEGRVAVGGWYMTTGGSNAFASIWGDLDAAEPTRLHATTLASPGAEADWFLDNAFDAEGNVYFAGYTTGALDGAAGGMGDAVVVRYDPDLANPVVRQVGTPASDQFRRIESAADGSLYAVGYTYGQFGGNGSLATTTATADAPAGDVLVVKLDTELEVIATQQIGGVGEERGYGALSGETLYVGGLTDGALAGPSAGSYDVWIAALATADLTPTQPPRPSGLLPGADVPRATLWPNPAGSATRIRLGEAGSHAATAVLTDAAGRRVATRLIDGETLDLTGVESGFYVVRLLDADGVVVGAARLVRR